MEGADPLNFAILFCNQRDFPYFLFYASWFLSVSQCSRGIEADDELSNTEEKLHMHFEVSWCNCSFFEEMDEPELSSSQGRSGKQGNHIPYYLRSLWGKHGPEGIIVI